MCKWVPVLVKNQLKQKKMKSLKLFFLCSLAFAFMTTAVTAQKIQLRTTTGNLFTYGDQARITTTDSAFHSITTVSLSNNTAGIIEVSVSGVDSAGNAVTGSQIVRYSKKSGTLTLGTPGDLLAKVTDGSLGTSTWNISTTDNNIIVQVKGKLNTTVRWRCLIKHVFP